MNKNQDIFRVRARIINQLGEQLIKNESIALLELIKNAYDADASYCNINMNFPASKDMGEIIIEDDGEGMNEDIIRNVWLEIGTDYKEKLRENNETVRSKKYRRLRLGEKGIGRLGVHKLGKEIELISRKENENEVVVNIDWDKINDSKYINEIPINIKTRKPVKFINKTGTFIRISNLRAGWNKRMVRDCYRSITSLNSPFDTHESFRVNFELSPDIDWLAGLLSFEDVSEYKLYSFEMTIAGDEIKKFHYEFTPWATMDKLKPRTVIDQDKQISDVKKMVYDSRKYDYINLNKYQIGEIRFKGIIFDLDSKTLNLGVIDKKGLKEYLKENGGIRVFRDNMRILEYGEKENDWLDLDSRRVNVPAKRISNNIIIGSVRINHESSQDLIEKANREGFIENDAYDLLRSSILYGLNIVETQRQIDKNLLRHHYGANKINEPVITSLSDLLAIIEENIDNEDLKNNISTYLNRIEKEYNNITSSLIRSAGAGLNLIMVIHQIEKLVKEVLFRIEQSDYGILPQIKMIADLVEGYTILIRQSEIKKRDITQLIDESLFNVEYRIEVHKIKLEKNYSSKNKHFGICSENHIVTAMMNIIDNSIYWLTYSKTQNPSIFISVSYELDEYVTILIADNGPGFSLDADMMTQAFISQKPDGMGIGLHLTNEIMKVLKGKLIFLLDGDIYSIPKKYHKGAKIALALRKG